ncbi:MAG: flagellar basal body rod protein FlgC [Rhodospirillaceae bacterium]
MDLIKSLNISAAGMKAQGTRLRVIAENVANADSLPDAPGAEPYRRKMVTFASTLDRALGAELVKVDKIMPDRGQFGREYNPQHPAADETGYVQTPNVKSLIELMDMREAQRSYEANLNMIEASKQMILQTIDLLKA